MGAARLPWTGAQSWLLLALLRTGVLCCVCIWGLHLGKGAGHTGMLPCPKPAGDWGSCWWQSCGSHCVVLLSAFCPPCRAKGPGKGIPGSHPPPLSQPWAQLCPTFTEVLRGQLWVCSGGSQAHGSPLHPAIGRRCPCQAAPSRRNTLKGHPSSRHRHQHRGAANGAVLPCTVAMEMITLSHADILQPRAPVQPLWHSLWCW